MATFIKSMPDENANVSEVNSWFETAKMRRGTSDPDWIQHADMDGANLHNLTLQEMMGRMKGWGLDFFAAEWLIERIVLARGFKAGAESVYQQTIQETVAELTENLIINLASDLYNEVKLRMSGAKHQLREEFGQESIKAMTTRIEQQIVEDIKNSVRERFHQDKIAEIQKQVERDLVEEVNEVFDTWSRKRRRLN